MKKLLHLLNLIIIVHCYSQQDTISVSQKDEFSQNRTMFKKYISKYTHYPSEALRNNLETDLILQLRINKTGHIDTLIMEGENINIFENEIRRVINLMPLWTPPKRNDVYVDTTITQRILFSMMNSRVDKKDSTTIEVLVYRQPISSSEIIQFRSAQDIENSYVYAIDNNDYQKGLRLIKQAEKNKYARRYRYTYYRGVAYYNLNYLDSACSEWLEGFRGGDKGSALEYDEHCKYRTDMYEGIANYENGNFEEAINHLDKAIEINPNDTNMLFYRAVSKLKLLDKIGAVEDLNSAITLGSSYSLHILDRNFTNQQLAGIYYKIAKKYAEIGDNQIVLEYYTKIIEVFPENPAAYLKRAELEIKIGDSDAACKDWQKSKNLGNEEANNFLKEYCGMSE